jgi:acetoin utilization deacetylase AcuC-like enzyme
MTTLYITHPIFLEHETPVGHPERAERLRVIETELAKPEFAALKRELAKPAERAALGMTHTPGHIAQIYGHEHTAELIMLDADTCMGPHSLKAALHAVGASLRAVDAVITGEAQNAFCAPRPPGHHAERDKAMGFCLFNNAAIAARYAQRNHGLKKIAIVDFDVHHGNGTQDIFEDDGSVFYASSHQWPCYPGTGAELETGVGNIFNVTLPPGTGGEEFRRAYAQRIFPALEQFAPELLILSAGFDAHWRDPLAQLELEEEDFAWVTEGLKTRAEKLCQGRLVSLLEGGYDLTGLSLSAAAHIRVLMS